MSVYDLYQSYLNQQGPAVVQPNLDIVSLYPQNYQGGGDGYSVYNPDPNMTRTSRNYNPRPAYEAAFGTMMGDPVANIATGALNKFDVMGSYREKPPSGLETLFNQYVKTSIPAQLIGGGVKGLLNMLPVNRTGIMQNELLGAGFALDNIGRIVAAPGKYNTPEGIMAGYNLTAREQDFSDPKNVFNKRDTNIRNTLKNKYGLNDQQIDQALSEIEEEGEYTGPLGYNETLGKTTNLFENLFNINKARNIIEDRQRATDIIYNRKLEERRDPITIANRKSAVAQETSNRDYARNAGRDRARDSAQSSATGRGATSATSSGLGDLGFSDIRLKENIELIGKSPSNINIYKFNYKNNPTTYQGAMAHEVPWASVKHSNGYMMVDYNLLDVDFKKYNA